MNSFILKTSSRILVPLLFGLSLFVLYRGHNLPGGGFIGGLIAASGYAFLILADSVERSRAALHISPNILMAIGLGFALSSCLPGLLVGDYFMQGIWLPVFELPLLGKVAIGTPLVFDMGVYLVVMGFTLNVTWELAELD